MTYWYRVNSTRYTDGLRIATTAYPVVKETPKGVWLDVYGIRTWVSASARKRYAYPTRAEAHASFVARKRRQIKLLTNQLAEAKQLLAGALAKADEITNGSTSLGLSWLGDVETDFATTLLQ